MIRIVHLITGLRTGGAERMLIKLLDRFDRKRFSSAVISLSGGPLVSEVEALGVDFVNLGMRSGIPGPKAVWSLLSAIRQMKPDVLQTWLYQADLAGTLAAQVSAVPRLVWNVRCSNMDMSMYPLMSSLALKACARLSRLPDAIITNSKVAQDHHESIGYSNARWVLIPNGFDLERFRPDEELRQSVRHELEISGDQLVIGTAARFDPMKDFPAWIRAAGEFLRAHPGTCFVLAGKGVEWQNRALAEEIAAANIPSRQLRLLGERTDMNRLLTGFDVFSLSSRFGEGFPNTIGEAMATGIPVAATDTGDVREIVGSTGEVVPPGQPEALAKAWKRLADLGRSGRQLLGAAARERVVQNYGIDRIADRYQRFYHELVARDHVEQAEN
jgi:glycosyltransferase involved in cell wall biosynthesis